jgi:hypothetical protein
LIRPLRKLGLALNAVENLLAVHCHVLGRLDANPDLIAFDAQDGNVDVIANLQGLANSSSEDQHHPSPCFGTPNVLRRSSQWNPLSWFF